MKQLYSCSGLGTPLPRKDTYTEEAAILQLGSHQWQRFCRYHCSWILLEYRDEYKSHIAFMLYYHEMYTKTYVNILHFSNSIVNFIISIWLFTCRFYDQLATSCSITN